MLSDENPTKDDVFKAITTAQDLLRAIIKEHKMFWNGVFADSQLTPLARQYIACKTLINSGNRGNLNEELDPYSFDQYGLFVNLPQRSNIKKGIAFDRIKI